MGINDPCGVTSLNFGLSSIGVVVPGRDGEIFNGRDGEIFGFETVNNFRRWLCEAHRVFIAELSSPHSM
jgi:hypothetical protein